jgi:hypothetical protein
MDLTERLTGDAVAIEIMAKQSSGVGSANASSVAYGQWPQRPAAEGQSDPRDECSLSPFAVVNLRGRVRGRARGFVMVFGFVANVSRLGHRTFLPDSRCWQWETPLGGW